MISIDQEDFAILKDILKKYPLTIYAYGSRVKNKHTKFSDLDLCVFDDTYKKLDLFNLKEDLKDSNLPFTVDVIAWSSMSESFQGLIKNDLTLLQSNPALLDCEENFLSKNSYLSQNFDFNIIQNQDYILIDSGINSSMFNVVYQKNQSVLPAEEVINYYKGQNFAWWFGSSGWQSSRIKILTENGFEGCLGEYCMGLDISDVYEVSSSITIKNITTIQGLKDYSGIIEEYSNVASRVYLNKKIIEPGFITKTPFFVSYIDQKPVGIGCLHFKGNNHAGIYDIFTLAEFRWQGVASNMMKYLINYCQQKGVNYLSLSTSSDVAQKMYQKLGFKLIGKFECYEKSS